ncbi:transcription initiation factor TFIID subunit 11 [Enteropsectra breve]|nr:transcription initiation factor TFIID subunit 11 [Enteropsectra breve]
MDIMGDNKKRDNKTGDNKTGDDKIGDNKMGVNKMKDSKAGVNKTGDNKAGVNKKEDKAKNEDGKGAKKEDKKNDNKKDEDKRATDGTAKEDEKKEDKQDDDESSGENASTYSNESMYRIREETKIAEALKNMSPEDVQRYGTFRKTNFSKGAIKKFISLSIGQAVNPNIVIGVAGISKIFVCEMVEEAKRVQKERKERGPLLPSHIHEAYRRMYRKMPNLQVFKKEPWNRW